MHPQPSRFAHLKILIVEDEPLILIDCEMILRDLGTSAIVAVTNAKDAAGALDAPSSRFDLALLDISLQDGSSLPLAHMLAARGVPVGFMSGYAHADLPEQFRDRPYIAKPFDPAQLKAMIERMMQFGEVELRSSCQVT